MLEDSLQPATAQVTPRCGRASILSTCNRLGFLHPAAQSKSRGSRRWVLPFQPAILASIFGENSPPTCSRITTPSACPTLICGWLPGSTAWVAGGRGRSSPRQKMVCGSAVRHGSIWPDPQPPAHPGRQHWQAGAHRNQTWAPRRLDQLRRPWSWPSQGGPARGLDELVKALTGTGWRWWEPGRMPACCFSICSRSGCKALVCFQPAPVERPEALGGARFPGALPVAMRPAQRFSTHCLEHLLAACSPARPAEQPIIDQAAAGPQPGASFADAGRHSGVPRNIAQGSASCGRGVFFDCRTPAGGGEPATRITAGDRPEAEGLLQEEAQQSLELGTGLRRGAHLNPTAPGPWRFDPRTGVAEALSRMGPIFGRGSARVVEALSKGIIKQKVLNTSPVTKPAGPPSHGIY